MGDRAPHPFYPDRWADGTVRAENQVALKHGAYSAAAKRGDVPTDLRPSVDEFRDGLVSDGGGASELSTLEAAYITRLGDVDVLLRILMKKVVTNGLFTSRDDVRPIYDKLLATFALWDRLAQRVGVDRRAKHVPSLQEFLQQSSSEERAAEQTREEQGE